MKETPERAHIQEIRTRAVLTAFSLGIPLDILQIVWEENEENPTGKLAVAEEVKKKGTTVQKAAWNRLMEPQGQNQIKQTPTRKPKTIREFEDYIKRFLHEERKAGYEKLFPEPNQEAIYQRFLKIKIASPEEAADFPPTWRMIRMTPEYQLREYAKEICAELTKQRARIIETTAFYLLEEMEKGTYAPSEVCEIIHNLANQRWLPNGTSQAITPNNDALPNELNARDLAEVVEQMRSGKSTKAALRETLKPRTKKHQPIGNQTGWITFKQSRDLKDAEKLQNLLANTNWCTGGSIQLAYSHLSSGNFYVYLENGEPQLAIRTNRNIVEEIRGRGDGQSIPNERLRNIAEEFLKSGQGPKGGADYLWDQEFRRACTVFNKTGKLLPILLETFNQKGEFTGKPKHINGDFEDEYIETLRKGLPRELLEYTDGNGDRHLLCSYHGEGKDMPWRTIAGNVIVGTTEENVVIPTEKIKGTLLIRATGIETTWAAPNLTSCGNIQCERNQHLVAQNLKTVHGKITSKVKSKLTLPNLEECGELYCYFKITTPKLKKARLIKDFAGNNWPNLEEVISFSSSGSQHLHLPELKAAGEIKTQSVWVSLPNLQELKEGKFLQAKHIDAPNLKHAGNIKAQQATKTNMPNLQICQSLIAPKLLTANFNNLRTAGALAIGGKIVNLQQLRQASQISTPIANTLLLDNLETVLLLFCPMVDNLILPKLKTAQNIQAESAEKIEAPQATNLITLTALYASKINLPNLETQCSLIVGENYKIARDQKVSITLVKNQDLEEQAYPKEQETWEEKIKIALNNLKQSGIMEKDLLKLLDQYGNLPGKVINPETGEEIKLSERERKLIEQARIIPSKIETISGRNGEEMILNTGLIIENTEQFQNWLAEVTGAKETEYLPFTRIEGNVIDKGGRPISAQILTTVGGYVITQGNIKLPVLKEIEGQLTTQGKFISLPALEKVGGLIKNQAQIVSLPNLLKAHGVAGDPAGIILAPKLNQTKYSVSQRGISWKAKLENGEIVLNAARLKTTEVEKTIIHELGHLAYQDENIKERFDTLWEALSPKTRKSIEELVKHNYSPEEQAEEYRVRALELLYKNSPKNLLEAFLQAVKEFWKKITGKSFVPQKEIEKVCDQILQTAVQKTKELKHPIIEPVNYSL